MLCESRVQYWVKEMRRAGMATEARAAHDGNAQHKQSVALPGAGRGRGVHQLVGDFRALDGYAGTSVGVLPHADFDGTHCANVVL